MQEDIPEKSLKNDEYFEYLCRCLEDKAETTNDLQKEGGKAMKKTADKNTVAKYWQSENGTCDQNNPVCINCKTLKMLGVEHMPCGSKKCRFLRMLAHLTKDGYGQAELFLPEELSYYCQK